MKLKNLDNPLSKTVFVRKQGRIQAIRIPVKNNNYYEPQPMFPISRGDNEKKR